jgi:hypothetical protein
VQITQQDSTVGRREPTIMRNHSLGREYFRSAEWSDGETTVQVTAVAFVAGVLARRNPDGSTTLLDLAAPLSTLGRDEFIQPVERAVFLWKRGEERAFDYSNEIGLFYANSISEAEAQCVLFLENLDFERNFDPSAWV